MQRTSVLTLALLAVLALGVGAPVAPAQCPVGPDGLDVGPCCGLVVPNLPFFPNALLPSLGVCWNQCSPSGNEDLRVEWTPLDPIACGEFISQLTVYDAFGTPMLSGLMFLSYTRTWNEVDPAGNPTQVWRFAVKVDIESIVGAPVSPCVTPACIAPIGPHPTAFYYGYMDYASCDPALGYDNTLVLYHACDTFIHRPGLSDKPGAFHPATSYGIIAPHTPLSPFVPMNLAAPSGPMIAEAVRRVDLTLPDCFREDPVDGDDVKLGRGCICTLSKNPKHQTFRRLTGFTLCPPGGSFLTLNVSFPTIPWLHLVSSSIGCWTDPGVYPGEECAWVDEGLFARTDACSPDSVEMKYGATTSKGWTVTSFPTPVGSFTDLTDNWTAPLAGPYIGPIVGSVMPTDHLVYINSP